MTSIRFPCVLDPRIEERIINQDFDKRELLIFLKELKIEIRQYPNLVLMIPMSFMPFLQTSELRLALSILKEGGQQSNVIFVPSKKSNECKEDFVSNHFSLTAEATSRKLVNLIMKSTFPLLISDKRSILFKNECNQCKGEQACGFSYEFETAGLDWLRSGVLKTAFCEAFKHSKKVDGIDVRNFDEASVRLTGMFLAGYYGLNEEEMTSLTGVRILEEFIDDIRGVKGRDFKSICFSLLRCVSFPSINDTGKASQFSIDWHPNNPSGYKGYSLFRCDVQEAHERGKIKSGAKRILIAKKENASIALAYTPNHEFSIDLIKKRIDELD